MRQPEEITINKKTLDKILINHKHWLDRDCNGYRSMRANLGYCDLHDVDLHDADLSYANLSYANLRGANLSGANLIRSDLEYANLRETDLNHANLHDSCLRNTNLQNAEISHATLRFTSLVGANLSYARLIGTDLYYADLTNADLHGASLDAANLRRTILAGTKGNLIEYRKGKILTEDIIGYKKCEDGVIVTLLIPRGAIVFSINGDKCRTNRAKVLRIEGANRAFSSFKYMSYYVGDEFNIYDFNCEYNKECASGIHFFLSKERAGNFYM